METGKCGAGVTIRQQPASACCGASPADIWVTCHARRWDRYRKFVARATAKNPVDPFIDPEGYRAYIDAAETEFRQGVVH
jgi:hypothetical protein